MQHYTDVFLIPPVSGQIITGLNIPLHQHGTIDPPGGKITSIETLASELAELRPDYHARACGFFAGLSEHGLLPIIYDIDASTGDILYSVKFGHINLDGFKLTDS